MTTKPAAGLPLLAAACALLLIHCAQGDVEIETNAVTTAATTAATGGGGVTGAGGHGGADPGPCAQDCSLIETPQCLKSDCNEGQYPGVVGQCVVVPDPGISCDDGVFCTIEDTCDDQGICVGGPPNDCGMAPPECEVVTCDEVAKTCGTMPAAAGAVCDPGDLCIQGATCNSFGECQGYQNDCFFAPVPDDCHVAVCNPMNGMCEPQIGNEGQACTDPADLCTVNKTCAMGVCTGGAPKDCSSLTMGCVNGVCDTTNGQCFAQPIMPGQPCLEATDDCNQGICDMNGVCQPVPANEGNACEDGNPCTGGETCMTGSCTGGMAITPTIHFSESFANNTAGWTLGTEWQIGPAMTSTGHTSSCGNGDPGTDHTSSTTDNGVAGVVIGGNASLPIHPFYYLTSPPINVANVTGPLWLGYWRWLNSDYTPFMQNHVQVWDGSAWVTLWQTGGSPGLKDAAWTQQVFDIAAYKNSALQVRFGFNINSTGVYTCSQWNVDDVVIADVICP